ncbi:MAG: septum site-determining protein MinC [Vulcanimicrobiaceae bacterium]
MLRGTATGLEFVFGKRAFDETAAEIIARLAERPEFYRGSRATAIFAADGPGDAAFARFIASVGEYGITVGGLYGEADCAAVAERAGVLFLGLPPDRRVASLEPRRIVRAPRASDLTPQARSLDADFAGARADLAQRRTRRGREPVGAATAAVTATAVAAEPTTLYHRGTLRGGQSLQHVGNIVVVGDVNPGAELVAGGDILVFGALRGTAHAGAQGDSTARVAALELVPTQLRIAALIAADAAENGRASEPEEAFVKGDRIAIGPFRKGSR